jgi:hypothetical protein
VTGRALAPKRTSAASLTTGWVCIALFFARVVGQIEVLLTSPSWLPPMSAWYSGLLPYPLLLPTQIALLMLMCAMMVSLRHRVSTPPSRVRFWRGVAMLYFLGMALRLLWTIHRYGAGFTQHGAIPVTFHWVLALFLMIWWRLALRLA